MSDLNARLRAAVEAALQCTCDQGLRNDHRAACARRYLAAVLAAVAPLFEALERDRERLDWLAGRMQVETLPPAPVYIVEIPMHDCPDPRDAHLRAAIDAAMLHALMAPSNGEPKP